jgi:hypothetical protein
MLTKTLKVDYSAESLPSKYKMLGNAINEKRRDASEDLDGMSEALHTVFGLNRYPNYLYRFRR